METPAQGAPAPMESACEAVYSTYSLSCFTSSQYAQIGAIFHAIKEFSSPGQVVHKLAGVGEYLCGDFANQHESEQELLKQIIDSFYAINRLEKR